MPEDESLEALESFQIVARILKELERRGECIQKPIISKGRGARYGKVIFVGVKLLS